MSDLITLLADGLDAALPGEGESWTAREVAEELSLRLVADGWKRTPDGFPEVVVLCGSTRFYPEFQHANFRLTMEGRIVLSVGFYAGSPEQMATEHGEGVGITPEQKIELDELHKRKIDLASWVFVLNVGGYIGDSTRSEIEYAEATGKPVYYLEPIS